MTYRFVIPISPISKKNSRPIFRNKKTGKVFLGKNKRLNEYEKALHLILNSQKNIFKITQPLSKKLRSDFTFEMKNTLRLDADNAMQGIFDSLQECQIIENDKLFKAGSWNIIENTGQPDRVIVIISEL